MESDRLRRHLITQLQHERSACQSSTPASVLTLKLRSQTLMLEALLAKFLCCSGSCAFSLPDLCMHGKEALAQSVLHELEGSFRPRELLVAASHCAFCSSAFI